MTETMGESPAEVVAAVRRGAPLQLVERRLVQRRRRREEIRQGITDLSIAKRNSHASDVSGLERRIAELSSEAAELDAGIRDDRDQHRALLPPYLASVEAALRPTYPGAVAQLRAALARVDEIADALGAAGGDASHLRGLLLHMARLPEPVP